MDVNPTLRILGTRGVPAAHGGFETFAEHLALYLVKRGWRVIVYCQEDGNHATNEDTWKGVERIVIPVADTGSKGTMLFDWLAIRHAAATRDLCLTLGYNTALFCAWLRLKRVRNIINMDGVEWRRAKWSRGAKVWLWLNDWAGCWLGDHLVADHPRIARHLRTRVSTRKISTIAYGAQRLLARDEAAVRGLGLEPRRYVTLIARAEPENSVLEIVRAFSSRPRGVRLAVLGKYDPTYPYHVAVQAAAGPEVSFLGAIYDKPVIEALRYHSLAYIHGHQVGGTNPSLVEALGAGNAVIAHDNEFNRWVAGDGARYFGDTHTLCSVLNEVVDDPSLLDAMRAASVARFESEFTWDRILKQYEMLLESWLPADQRRPARATVSPAEIGSLGAGSFQSGFAAKSTVEQQRE